MIEAAALMALLVQDWGDFTIITSLLVFNAAARLLGGTCSFQRARTR